MRSPTPTRDRRRDSTGEASDKGKQPEKRGSWGSATQVTTTTRSSSPAASIQSGSTERTFKAMSTVSTSSSVGSSSVQSKAYSSGGRVHKIEISNADGREWYIETDKPPTTASSAQGPFELAHLVTRLGITVGEAMKLDQ